MEVHYFQRYHQKENVHTSNALLLLSRLYAFSHDKFYAFLRTELLGEQIEPGVVIRLQEKHKSSVPDAIISQDSYKIVIETKLNSKSFSIDQLKRHLDSFSAQSNKVLLTLAPQGLSEDEITEIKKLLIDKSIVHKHLTFEGLIEGVEKQLLQQDFDLSEILEDYRSYCIAQNLIPSRNQMRVIVARTTFKTNKKLNLYYDDASRGFSEHDYIGLFINKSVQAIGKRNNTVVALSENNSLKILEGNPTEDQRARILEAIEDSREYGYRLDLKPHRYFFVEKFYDMDFRKASPYPIQRAKFFNLGKLLKVAQMPSTREIAQLLSGKTWEEFMENVS